MTKDDNNKLNVNSLKKSFTGFLNGSIVASDFIKKQLSFIIVLFIIGLIYIANRYHAESVYRETEKTKKEIEDLRAAKVEIQSNLMIASRREKVLKLLEEKGSLLKDSKTPPVKITYKLTKIEGGED